MKAMNRWWAALLLALPGVALAMNAVMYQPQLRDRAVAGWPQIFAGLRERGIDTLVLQWTRYGGAFAEGEDRRWLAQRLIEARQAGLALVLGLDADPDFFLRQRQPGAALDAYLRRLGGDNARLAESWRQQLGADAIAGWYLPAEVDDVNWQEPARLALLRRNLQRQRLWLGDDKPVYLSAFFSGHAEPARYATLLAALSGTGVRIWVQDGAGTGKLSAAERRRYLAPLSSCDDASAAGVVSEVFVQQGPDTQFSARPMAAEAQRRLLAAPQPCGRDRVLFSLRYLYWLDGRLPR